MKKKFYLNMVVWGEVYTDHFLSVTLPTLLADRNLPALAAFGDCRFSIYTHPRDESAMRSNNAFTLLSSLMTVEFIDIAQEQSQHDAWFTMSTCQNRSIRTARLDGAYVVFIIPDHVYSENSFCTVVKAVSQGYKGVLVLQIAAKRDSFIEAFIPAYVDKSTCTAVITTEELLTLWKRHKHPGSDFYLWDSRHFPNDSPCLIGWSDDDTFVVRSSQFTPLMLLPETDFLLPTEGPSLYTLDTILAKSLVIDQREIYIVQDSSEGVQVDMRPLSQGYAVSFDRPNIPMIACHLNWFKQHGNGNIEYMDRPVWFHMVCAEVEEAGLKTQADGIYYTIKDMADFNTVEQFLLKLRDFFAGKANERSFAVLGSGYVAELTNKFIQQMNFETRFIDNIGSLGSDEYLLLANELTKMEMQFFELSVKGLKYEEDFLITPCIYRQFRKLIGGRRSWKRYYYDYYITARENGIRWTLKVILRKLMLAVSYQKANR